MEIPTSYPCLKCETGRVRQVPPIGSGGSEGLPSEFSVPGVSATIWECNECAWQLAEHDDYPGTLQSLRTGKRYRRDEAGGVLVERGDDEIWP